MYWLNGWPRKQLLKATPAAAFTQAAPADESTDSGCQKASLASGPTRLKSPRTSVREPEVPRCRIHLPRAADCDASVWQDAACGVECIARTPGLQVHGKQLDLSRSAGKQRQARARALPVAQRQ